MPSLATARTRLSLAGVPKQPEGSFAGKTPIPVRSAYEKTFSRFSLTASPGRPYGVFDKQQVAIAEISVSDLWIASFTEDPVDENEVIGTDDWQLSVSDIATLRNNLSVVDTFSTQVIENIGLLQSGVILQSVTDNWSVTFTEGVGDVRVTLDVTDTLSAQFNMATPTVAFPLELKEATDDFNVTLSSEEASLQIFVGVVPLNAFDTWTVTLSTEGAGFEVQQPIGRIAFRVLTNKIRFEFV